MNAKVILICLMAVVATNAYSSGAPDDACFDMVPQHGVNPQSTVAPYRVFLSQSQIRSGGKVDITIQGVKRSDTIKGFMIQARVGESPTGRWLVDKNHAFGQTLDCGRGSGNAITHKRINGDGVDSLTFTWQAPAQLSAKVHFRATIALNGGVFWVGVVSDYLSVF
ncbi:putative defense protein Hdd11-like [Bradysia coprophila]|uniref:putative defense protein Hdd11-like n=1 Tax=Bradysia coprophila TaxID=38358 RepID=UPI00187D917F|nr:putative defense protein Hdd11-like [Bradysia coprophila]XP_037039999.1 putative defense protein Hdd11-like [Bradysia coprophila]